LCGIDEVGMGCLAGPVVAAACIFREGQIPNGIRDSKLLTAKRREELDVEIRETALSFAIASATVEEIDTINILQAARLAMRRAIGQLNHPPHYLLIDGRFPIKEIALPQQAIIKGDRKSVSIGAASILAKVFRDRLMAEMDTTYPGYGFAQHKGYGSELHRKAMQNLGVTPLHRKSFSWTPVREDGAERVPEAGLSPLPDELSVEAPGG